MQLLCNLHELHMQLVVSYCLYQTTIIHVTKIEHKVSPQKCYRTTHFPYVNNVTNKKHNSSWQVWHLALPRPRAAISVANRTAYCLRTNDSYISRRFMYFILLCSAKTVTPGRSRRNTSCTNRTCNKQTDFTVQKQHSMKWYEIRTMMLSSWWVKSLIYLKKPHKKD